MSVKRIYISLFLFFLTSLSFAQEVINYQKEVLFNISLSNKDVELSVSEEGIYGLSAPAVLSDGTLMLLPTNHWEKKYLIKNNKLSIQPTVRDEFFMVNPVCQNGFVIGNFDVMCLANNKIYDLVDFFENKFDSKNYREKFYFVPKGIVFHWINKTFFCALEINDGGNIEYVDSIFLNDWLTSQSGNFSYDEDNNVLYRNDIKWSSNYEKYTYLGKLKSGHNVLLYGNSNITEGIIITDSNDEVVLKISFPEAYVDNYINPICTSIGNFGELYLTSYPKIEVEYSGDRAFYSPVGDNFEISCVRNHLRYFGVLTDDRIRLRSEATTSSESLGTYPINTGFRILEKGTKQETIGGDTGVWYKVRLLDGKEGWFFGAYVRDLYDGPGTPLPWPNVADWK